MGYILALLILLFNSNAVLADAAVNNPDAALDESYPVLSELNFYVVKADVQLFLSDEAFEGYKKLVDAVLARQTHVKLSKDFDCNLTSFAALQGNPLYFFVKKLTFTDKNTAVKLTYNFSQAEQDQMLEFIQSEYLSLINEIIEPGMNELDKALAVYRYFAARIDYDYEWLDTFYAADDKFLFPDIEIYRALSTNKGVCHSYTYLCEFAYQQIGIECLRFSGQMAGTDEGHMWLVLRINGEYYHCDPTWDSHGVNVALRHFGMTDDERRDTGVENFELSYDMAYGQVNCTSSAFSDLRGVEDFYFTGEPHRIYVHIDSTIGQYDTESMAFCD